MDKTKFLSICHSKGSRKPPYKRMMWNQKVEGKQKRALSSGTKNKPPN